MVYPQVVFDLESKEPAVEAFVTAYRAKYNEDPDIYAAPSRAEDLSGLPPAFVTVGEFDNFRDEDIDYAQRLMAESQLIFEDDPLMGLQLSIEGMKFLPVDEHE